MAGRPATFTPELGTELQRRLAEGQSVRRAAGEHRGRWRCPDCTYQYEYGEGVREPVERGTRRMAQKEGLFPLSDVPKADLRHRRVSLLHLRGMPWARIGEFIGQRDLSTTADTYTHVLISEAELDYEQLLAA